MNYRQERKYILNNNISNQFFVSLLNSNFRTQHSSRLIHSIYFDTPDLSSYRSNIEGLQNRYKVRIRWYNEDTNNAKLEIKIKEGNFGKKIVKDLSNFNPNTDLQKQIFNIENLADIEIGVLPYLKSLVPATYNYYTRNYYASFDNKIRLTVDTNMYFKRLFTQYLVSKNQMNFLNQSVIELKYDIKNESRVSQILKNTPLKISKFSKYVSGIIYG
jgi:SPX domain protein involved in polyphosphate accumulation